jgi:hypothetical protein
MSFKIDQVVENLAFQPVSPTSVGPVGPISLQDEIGGPISIGSLFVTLFKMEPHGNYLLTINTRGNDGTYGLFICYQEESGGLVVALNQNNIITQVVGNNVQVKSANGYAFNIYYAAKRLL